MDDTIQDRIRIIRTSLIDLKQLFFEQGLSEEIYQIIMIEMNLNLTENQVCYFERLVGELKFGKSALEVLLYLNFNSRNYFNHRIKSIQSLTESEETSFGKLERLRHEQKVNNQIPCEFDIAFNDKHPALQQMISDWILEEIKFIEHVHSLTPAAPIQVNEFAKKDFKFEFDMSVAQFAFMIKTFIETGIVQNKNISELIRFLSRFVKTKRSGNISYESFRMKYYNVESGTKDSLKNLLHNAIGYINSN